MSYLSKVQSKKKTPQSQPIPGSTQVANSAGGYGFAVNDWTRLDRFLVLGSEGGTYYAKEQALTRQNADAVARCIQTDGRKTVARIVEISEAGRAPKNDPAIFALAMAASLGDLETRRAALAALPEVCRIGTHLFHFAQFTDGMRGWGRGLRQAIAHWYESMPADKLALQAVKYQQRDGWSHRDLLRLAHPKPQDETHLALYHWMTQGWPGVGDAPHPDAVLRLLWAFERAKATTDRDELIRLIGAYKLPREAVPTQWLSEMTVWEALLAEMPMTAMIRNLATMTKVGLLTAKNTSTQTVTARLRDEARLHKSRVHPIAVLSALKTYAQGHGERGNATWTPVRAVVDALDAAFYASFGNVAPTGKRWLLALDVSGSMDGGQIAGVPGLTPRLASAAMAMITVATETNTEVVAFTSGGSGRNIGGMWGGMSGLTPLTLSPRQRLDDVVRTVSRLPMGGTDCALPMVWALKKKVPVDVFVVYTDNETWAGSIHPVQALREYRQQMGIAAKLIVVGMTATQFSIADPNDAGMLDVVGFDQATPQLMSDFARG